MTTEKPKKKKRISVSAAKSKGRRLQKKTATRISELIDIPCGKDELIESREMGQAGCDVKLIGEARRRFPYSIECKAQEKWGVFSWLRQAQTNTMPDTDWLLICCRNNFSAIVVLDRTTFIDIMSAVVTTEKELTFNSHAQYDLKAWKLPLWIQDARLKNRHTKQPWYLECKCSTEFDVVALDFDIFFKFLESIPGDVKR